MRGACLICGKGMPESARHYHPACLRKVFAQDQVPALEHTQEELNELARQLVMQRVSLPGVQPKLSLHLEKHGERGSRLTIVGFAGDYILKPQSKTWPHLPEAEHFCMLLAEMCRIKCVDFALVPLRSGELAYVCRRMDRSRQGMLHLEDFCQVLGRMTSQKYRGSMEQIARALRLYSSLPGLDLARFFELSLYSFLSGNSDMHLKNFSLLRQAEGGYSLAPAYDLLPVKVILPEDREEMALSVNGKKNRLKRSDFESMAKNIGLSKAQADKMIAAVSSSVRENLEEALRRSFMPDKMRGQVAEMMLQRLARL
ncbi:MAG: HipA domain-containing protein [Lentisphaeria bacterium]|nr:HipA domain-containing protein [Lentisphaeria bacterium]